MKHKIITVSFHVDALKNGSSFYSDQVSSIENSYETSSLDKVRVLVGAYGIGNKKTYSSNDVWLVNKSFGRLQLVDYWIISTIKAAICLVISRDDEFLSVNEVKQTI